MTKLSDLRQRLQLLIPNPPIEVSVNDERESFRVAEHVLITAIMNTPQGTSPEHFLDLVIQQVRANQNEKIKDLSPRLRGLGG